MKRGGQQQIRRMTLLTAALMRAFFKAVVEAERSGKIIDYAEALHKAKQALRAEEAWASPYHWAPFILIGKGSE